MKEKFITAFKDALEIANREIELTDNFRDYGEWDSLTQLTLIAMLDSEFQVSIETQDFDNLITVEELMNEVHKRMNQ